MPIVPPQYGRREMHPVVLLRTTPVEVLVDTSPLCVLPPTRRVEVARFGDFAVLVNHRSSPIDISGIPARRQLAQVPSAPGWLAAHAATFLEMEA